MRSGASASKLGLACLSGLMLPVKGHSEAMVAKNPLNLSFLMHFWTNVVDKARSADGA